MFLQEFIERCLEQDPIRRANVAELLSRLGPPEPDKNDETSLDEEGLNDNEQQQEESSNATHELTPIPTTITADRTKSPPNEVMHNIAAPITSNITTAHQQPMTIATNTSNPTIDQHFQTQQQSGYLI
jgi:serine/threonine protein kinase